MSDRLADHPDELQALSTAGQLVPYWRHTN